MKLLRTTSLIALTLSLIWHTNLHAGLNAGDSVMLSVTDLDAENCTGRRLLNPEYYIVATDAQGNEVWRSDTIEYDPRKPAPKLPMPGFSTKISGAKLIEGYWAHRMKQAKKKEEQLKSYLDYTNKQIRNMQEIAKRDKLDFRKQPGAEELLSQRNHFLTKLRKNKLVMEDIRNSSNSGIPAQDNIVNLKVYWDRNQLATGIGVALDRLTAVYASGFTFGDKVKATRSVPAKDLSPGTEIVDKLSFPVSSTQLKCRVSFKYNLSVEKAEPLQNVARKTGMPKRRKRSSGLKATR